MAGIINVSIRSCGKRQEIDRKCFMVRIILLWDDFRLYVKNSTKHETNLTLYITHEVCFF